MAIEISQEKKFNWKLIIVILILVIIGYLVWLFLQPSENILKKTNTTEVVPPTTMQITNISLNINQILQNPIFTQLISHINLPLITPQTGRTNPFLPF